MSTITVYGSSSDGHMYARTADHFSNARDAASAYALDVSSDEMRVGLGFVSPQNPGDKYRFYRMYLYFDTSSIPDGATIVSASVSLYLVGDLQITPSGFALVLGKMKGNDETYPHDPLVLGDFNNALYTGGGASTPWVYDSQSGMKTFTFTSLGKSSWINDQGTSKFVVMSSLDVGYSIPNYYMLADFYTQEKGGGYRPVMSITYVILPTITTNAATALVSSGATGNGTINDLEGESVISYGAIWNDDGTDPVSFALADNYAAGSDLAAGDFSAAITGCDPETAYYYRAYTQTVAGYGVGSAVQFTTTAVLDVLSTRTDAAEDVAATTATFNGIVLEDAAHALTAYGFVYKKGGDPGTPADPTTAEAYTDLGAKASPAEGAYHSHVSSLVELSTYFFRAYATTSEDGTAYGGVELARTGAETETTFDGGTNDGYLGAYGDNYDNLALAKAAADEATTANYSNVTNNLIYVDSNWHYYHYPYRVWKQRGYVFFDTSSIPSGATIISATLKLYVKEIEDLVGDPSTLYVAENMPTYPHSTLVNDDYNSSGYSNIASIAFGNITESQYNEIAIPVANVTKEGTTKYMLDTGVVGSNDGWCGYVIEDGEDALYPPQLVVTYSTTPDVVLPKVNLGDTWVQTLAAHVNIGDAWVELDTPLANLGDDWVEPTG